MSLSASADFNALKFRMHIKAELYRARLHSEKVRTAIAVAFDRHRGNIRLPLQELEYFGDKLLHVTHIAIAAGESIAAKVGLFGLLSRTIVRLSKKCGVAYSVLFVHPTGANSQRSARCRCLGKIA
jgi:hypothetical protein